MLAHRTEFQFLFVLSGTVRLDLGTLDLGKLDHGALDTDDGDGMQLGRGDAVSIPGAVRWALRDSSADLELLDVTLPALVAVR